MAGTTGATDWAHHSNDAFFRQRVVFEKKPGWWPPSEDFVREWEAYGLSKNDFFQAREGYPDYYEYHWLWREPFPGDKVFRKCYTVTLAQLRQSRLPEHAMIAHEQETFVEGLTKYYFFPNAFTRSTL